MKPLITLLFFLRLLCANAQLDHDCLSFSVALDPRNATVGSTPTNSDPALDLLFQASILCNAIEAGVGYEAFPKLDFSKYSVHLAYHFPLYCYPFGYEIKTTLIPGIEPSCISRYRNWGGGLGKDQENRSFASVGLNLSLRWDVGERWSVEYLFNALPRTDLKSKFPEESWYGKAKLFDAPVVGTSFIKVVYKVSL